MKSKIFNAQEVQAIISGNKRQFREVIKGAELEISHPAIHSWAQSPNDQKFYAKAKNDEVKQQYVTTFPFHGIKCPYQVRQKIFVKERFFEEHTYRRFQGFEKQDNSIEISARYMKQEQSRITLQIKKIGVERISEISEEDCWKEGLEEFADYQDQVKICEMAKRLGECIEDPKSTFAVWWNATHKKPEEKFEANPWVWAIDFEVVK